MAQARVEDIVAVFGGSGFLGREVVRALIGSGHSVCIAVRDPARARHIQGFDEPSRTNFVRADVTDAGSVSKALSGASTAVNVVAAYVEKGGITYSAIHEEGAKIVAQQAANAGLACLVHVSGIGSNPRSKSKYIRSRGKGEQLVEDAFPDAVIVRPSVMFGPNDAFLNTLDQVSRVLPALPAFGKGRTRLQPVFVEDVAAAIVHRRGFLYARQDLRAWRSQRLLLPGPDSLGAEDLQPTTPDRPLPVHACQTPGEVGRMASAECTIDRCPGRATRTRQRHERCEPWVRRARHHPALDRGRRPYLLEWLRLRRN